MPFTDRVALPHFVSVRAVRCQQCHSSLAEMLEQASQPGTILAHAVKCDEARCWFALGWDPSPGDIVLELAMVELNPVQEILLSIPVWRSTLL